MRRGLRTYFEEVPVEMALKVAEQENSSVEELSNTQGEEKESSIRRATAMAEFDIFAAEQAGRVMWQGTAETLEDAQATIRKLTGTSHHREYIIFNLRTGRRLTVKPEGPQNANSDGMDDKA